MQHVYFPPILAIEPIDGRHYEPRIRKVKVIAIDSNKHAFLLRHYFGLELFKVRVILFAYIVQFELRLYEWKIVFKDKATMGFFLDQYLFDK